MTVTWELIVSICGGITAICVAFGWVWKGARKAGEPLRRQEERLTGIETRLAGCEERLNLDNNRLKAVEDGNRVVQKAMLALLAHGIDGNDIAALKEAKDELQKYLIDR